MMLMPLTHDGYGRAPTAANALSGTAEGWRRKPAFGLDATRIDGDPVAVREVAVLGKPFCSLVHFKRQTRRPDPRLLLVAPLSGQFAALLRDMVAALLPEHDVYVTDWTDARDVPLADGPFGLDDNVGYVIDFARALGPGTHLVGLCQSAIAALAATALLAAADDPAQPPSLTLIAGLVDPRIAPTRVERLLASRPVAWFERTVIATVPAPYPGHGRRVYPGLVQYTGLMAYLGRHIGGRLELYRKLVDDGDDAANHPFFELYSATMDLTAEFFLDTLRGVFHDHDLARGRMRWRGRPVEPGAVSRTALMTIEGEHDDVSGPGQTAVAHDLCPAIPAHRRRRHVAPGVGHFGTYHGRHWRTEVMPRLRDFVRAAA